MVKNLLIFVALACPAHAQSQAWAWDDGTVPYVQTPMEIVERMLRMAEVRKDDYIIDLGSGDGRIVIEAAKRGARGVGVDLDPNLVKLATENAQKAGVSDRARFEVRDIFDTDRLLRRAHLQPLVGRPVADAAVVGYDARAGLEPEQPRQELGVEIGQEVERDYRGGGKVGRENVLHQELGLVGHPGLLRILSGEPD